MRAPFVPGRPTPTGAAAVTPPPAPSVPPARPTPSGTGAIGRPTPSGADALGRDTPTGSRRPVNPFLANDPNAKARRLARALVSDIVTYFPDKHRQALAAGTLRDAFEEEIRKSHQEYVDQVGREFAESTPHFQDALNEILAGGQRIF